MRKWLGITFLLLLWHFPTGIPVHKLKQDTVLQQIKSDTLEYLDPRNTGITAKL